MKTHLSNNLLEFCCPILVLSYFFIHNILLVLIGILFSLYFINIKKIRNFISNIKIKREGENSDKNTNVFDNPLGSISTEIDLNNKASKLTLVEIIEAEGIIPSLYKNNDIDAA